MPAADIDMVITKLVTVHPENPAAGLPSVQAEVLVAEAATGRRLLLLDGATVTAHRTAALSLLAAQTLAPNPSGPLLIAGAGIEARAHLAAFAAGLGVREFYITSRNMAHAAALAAWATGQGLAAQAIPEAGAVLADAPLIVTATTSPTPVVPATVRPDAFIAAVGAYLPDRAELPPTLVRAAHLVVDTLEGAEAEAGDLIQAEVDWHTVQPLEAAVLAPRPASGPVVFKSVGHSLCDLAAARFAWRQVRKNTQDPEPGSG
jgi:ornithine cyclodeaminase